MFRKIIIVKKFESFFNVMNFFVIPNVLMNIKFSEMLKIQLITLFDNNLQK